MSSSNNPNTRVPRSPRPDDDDSDLEIDLQELDPHTSTTPGLSIPRKSPESSEQPPKEHIALRNLRMSNKRRGARRERRFGELEHDAYGGDGTWGTDSSNHDHDDDSPLLDYDGGMRRNPGRPSLDSYRDRAKRMGSRLRLPSFMQNSPKSMRSPIEEDEQEEDHDPASSRIVIVGGQDRSKFPPNAVSNAKYTAWSFLPITLYNEFSFFFNMYFLLVALSQAIPALRIGYLSTYIVPLLFVLAITLGKEAFDDIGRRKRDSEANAEAYTVLKFEAESGFRDNETRKRRKKNKKDRARDRLMDIREEEEAAEGDGSGRLDTPSAAVMEVLTKSRDLKVGDVLKLGKDQRVPADVVILKSYTHESRTSEAPPPPTIQESLVEPVSEPPVEGLQESGSDSKAVPSPDGGNAGETFIRTDQLDGETDWKLRLGSPLTQSLPTSEFVRLRVTAGKPDKKVNEFVGSIALEPKRLAGYHSRGSSDKNDGGPVEEGDEGRKSAGLGIDNTAWANTVLASNATTLAVIVYTGPQTRSALSTSASRSKTGLLEYEINSLVKILCALTLSLSVILVVLEALEGTIENGKWYVKMMRFLVLFSTIVPISLRVNLDMAKSVYSYFIERDSGIPDTLVRTSTIPEELGRIEYLLSDKTGTLTQNEMVMRKIHVGTVSYANDAMDEVASYIRQGFSVPASTADGGATLITPSSTYLATSNTATRTRREIGGRVRDLVLALAICHNVTPTLEEIDGREETTYQASSPDEIAIVRWTEAVGLCLLHRDRQGMLLQSVDTGRAVVRVKILEVFPFTSEGKRMGIIVQFFTGADAGHDKSAASKGAASEGEIWFFQKGADTVMSTIVTSNDWLDEEAANMAREGLRTLVIGRKRLSLAEYTAFSSAHMEASQTITNRAHKVQKVISQYLETDLELLGVTGVEDKLQQDVKPSLELLRNAGIKIWMLTGDKVETARCVAVSAKLVARGQYVHTISKLRSRTAALEHLDFLRGKLDACLLIDGESLALYLRNYQTEFISVAVLLPAVVACRCSPTQKADIAHLIRRFTHKRVACIGDGGNDVSMIQAADVGIGIVGKEGRQASLAADFSITQFSHLVKLLVWHGRNSYKRSAKLAQFVIHRGLIISVCQTVYSCWRGFEPEGLFIDWLMVGYATVYTMAPVFSLVLDRDVDEGLANLYPELYKELTTGAALSYKTFFIWVAVSLYQGIVIQGGAEMLVQKDGPRMVAVSFTCLVFNELIMVATEITTWNWVMALSIVGTACVYIASTPALGGYFDLGYMVTV